MKIPDKIYCGNNGHGNLSYSTEKNYPSMEEYIRKDALLEWAKNELESARQTDFDEFGRGEVITLESIIKKLKSL